MFNDNEDNDKEMQMKVLQEIMDQMDDYDFDRKVKPKMEVDAEKTGSDDLPSDIKDLLGGEKPGDENSPEEVPPGGMDDEEMGEGDDSPMEDDEEEQDPKDALGSRLAKLFGRKSA